MKKTFLVLMLISYNFAFCQAGWQSISLPSPIARAYKISFANADTGYLLSPSGVFKSTNGGINWQQKSSALGVSAFSSLHIIDANSIIIGVADPNIFFITTNGGNNWTGIGISPAANSDIKFFNYMTGFLLCTASQTYIHKTVDGGIGFKQIAITDSSDAFLCMKFVNQNTGWVTGLKSVYKTTNGGINWFYQFHLSPSTGNSFKGNSIDFTNELTGYIAGAGGYLYKTTNGGAYWETTKISFRALLNVTFVNQNIGWICGAGGTLLQTTNAGTNWVQYSLDTNTIFYKSNFFNANTGWICSNKNYILKTTNGGAVFISQTSSAVPESFELNQNYPNPFNPSTTINYEIKNSAAVKLIVYDSKGNEVETLVNENQSAGTYSVVFNAAKLSSGVYYYKLESESFSETKKMLLVK